MKKRGMKLDKMRIVVSADIELHLLTEDKFSNTFLYLINNHKTMVSITYQ